MNILMLNLYIINVLINFVLNESKEIIKFYSYEIKLKVKGTGIKNILSASSSYTYQCPTIIYINELVQDVTDCHFVNIKNSDSEIKLVWNNINIQSTKGMFYNCNEITEIDMIKFDTSLVNDMSNMFSMCTSLKSIKVDNLVTSKVETFENMFYNCTSLTSLNLESFTNPSAISLTRMFYGCINLEYINIKNFEEKENINLDDMFYNIPQNTVICLLSCPPPTNFTISTMTATTVRISWEGNEWNKFIISYDLQNLENPEDGNKIYVTDKSYYTFTNLDSAQRYDVYIKTDCGSKSSYWLGPLLVSIESYNMAHTGTGTIITCSKVIYDPGGPYGNYSNYDNSILTLYPEITGRLISLKGTINLEPYYDYFLIYDGIGTNGKLFGNYSGINDIPLIVSISGPLTLKFVTDYSIVNSGFQLTVGCIINSPKTIYNLIKDNNCTMIYCDNDWKKKQNLLVLNSEICDNDQELNLDSGEYYKCYPKCDNYYYFNQSNNYICLDKKECPDNYKYLIEEKNQCVSDCKLFPDFPIDFQKKCYNSCPLNISEISNEKRLYNDIKCPKDLPYLLIENQKCINSCSLSQIINKKCKLNFNIDNKIDEKESQEKMVENVREEIINGLNTSGIDKGDDIIIQENDVTLTISKTDNQLNQINSKTNTTNIDLGKCESKLKEHYNISENDSLYILKMDIKQAEYKIPKIQYEVYYPLNNDSKLCLLNLSICEDIDIDIYLPLELKENINLYDPNSDFYNDICNTYTSENGTDLTLADRKKNYINNNLAICEENCFLKEYNENIGKAKCSCETKTEFINKISENVLNKEDLLKNFVDFNNIFNLKVLKCINLILSTKSLKENYANIILIILVILNFICLILFICNYKNDFTFYIDIMTYFTLFPNKIINIILKKEKRANFLLD